MHVLKWPASGSIKLPAVSFKLKQARLIGGGQVMVKLPGEQLEISVDENHRQLIDAVVTLDFDEDVIKIPVINDERQNQ